MKKAIISAAIMVAMGTGLTFGTSAVTPHNEVNAQAATEEPIETQISDTNVTLRMNSSETEAGEAEEPATEEPVVTEEPAAEPECEYPEWQDSVVANVQGSLRVRGLKLQHFQQFPYVPPLLLGVERGEIVQIVHCAQIGVQIGELKQDTDLLKKFRAVGSGDVLPKQRYLSAVAFHNPGQNFLGRRFPGAVWPQDAEDFSVPYSEI